MKIFTALATQFKKTDNTSTEHLEKNRTRATLETMCETYLGDSGNILEFEALPKALPYIVSILEEPVFLEKYEFQQVTESLFQIRNRELNIM